MPNDYTFYMINSTYDLVIIGGGINGTAIALEAAGRGLKTLLCEKNDLASATSSASTKLIHGGLRYLASFDFSLVIESLKDRNNLAQSAPHLVKPLEFYIPFQNKRISYWQTKLGLAFYNHFAKLPPSQSLSSKQEAHKHFGLKKQFSHFLSYQDCYTDDARLVIANAKKAHELGVELQPYTELVSCQQENHYWRLTLKSQYDMHQQQSLLAKTVINASGPWVEHIHTNLFKCKSDYQLKLIQGSHLLVPKIVEQSHAYLLPASDGRVIFIIPYLDKFSLIGTTDVELTESITQKKSFDLTRAEITYLLKEVNAYLAQPLTEGMIVAHWSGARALPIKTNEKNKAPSQISREFKLELVQKNAEGPFLLSVWGGKLTTHRSLAVKAMNLLGAQMGLSEQAFIYSQKLNSPSNYPVEENQLLKLYPFIPEKIKKRWLFNYGADCLIFLSGCEQLMDLGIHFGQGFYEIELKYLLDHEWAITLDDILYRRTKLGYFLSAQEKNTLQLWLDNRNKARVG